MTRKHFTENFRKEAVRLALNSGLSRHQVADDLGVGHSTLGKWISAYRHDDISTMEKIHKIVGDTATIENLNEAKSVLNALALQRELFPASDFPWPSEGESNTPHDHGDSWAIVAGIEGQEKHDLYTRIDNNTGPGNASLELSASVTIDAGEAVSMLQGGIHSVEAIGTGPVLMLHCYGKAYEDQLSRLEFDLGTGKSAYGTTATGAISDLPLHP